MTPIRLIGFTAYLIRHVCDLAEIKHYDSGHCLDLPCAPKEFCSHNDIKTEVTHLTASSQKLTSTLMSNQPLITMLAYYKCANNCCVFVRKLFLTFARFIVESTLYRLIYLYYLLPPKP